MKISRLGAVCLASVWFAACATAQDGSLPGMSDGGSAGDSSTGATGNTTSFSGSSNSFGGGAGTFGTTGGTTGSSGATGTGGLLGTGGTAGSGGAGGGAGTASGGGGGSGGSTPVFDTGACAASPTMQLSYEQSNTGQQITGEYQFINTSDTPIPLSSLTIRYFFTNEHTSGWGMHIYDSKVDGGTGGYRAINGTTFTLAPLSPPLEGADSYTEVAFPGATATVEKGATGTVSWDMQPNGYNAPFQVQSDDYSFNAADTAFTVWDHIAIFQGNTLVWGCVPKSLDDGSAGAGGDTGTAGAPGAAGDTGAAGAP